MLRRSKSMISMERRDSKGEWEEDHRVEEVEECPTLVMVKVLVTHTMETPGQHFHSSLEEVTLLLHSSQQIQEAWGALKVWILILKSLLVALDPEEECLVEDSLEDPEVLTMVEEVQANRQRSRIKP